MTYKPISLHRFMAVIIMAATMCCVACRHDDDNSDDGIVPTEVADAPFYLQLSVSVDNGGQTRGGDNPWGGESGDGNYVGSTDEKQINNAILLLYKTTNSANININADEIKVLDAVVFPEFEPIGSNWIAKTPQKVNPSLIDNEFHAIVITNIDPNNNKIYTLAASMKGQPLSTVRDMAIDSHPWFLQGPSLYSWFAMCSKNDDVIRFVTGGDNFQGGSGTETNPYIIGNIVVERLAARIDISPSPAANASNPGWNSVYKSNYNSTGLSGYLFRVDDGETTSSTDSDYDHFLLTGVDVANIPNEDFGTYFIRRTLYYDTEDKPQLEYFGQDASGTTSTKWTLTRWTSKIRDDLFAASYASKYETKSNITLPADLTSSKKYFTAAYAVENTFLSRNASGSVY